jgi:hypothetical protein
MAGAIAVIVVVQAAMLPFAVLDTGHGPGWIATVPRLNRISSAVLEWGASILYRRATVTDGLLAGAALLIIVTTLVLTGGDRRTRDGAGVAAAVAGCVFVLPLALGVVGQDYFLTRNVMPAVVPVAVLLAAACLAPRTRVVGAALAAVLLALFGWAAIRVQTHPYLERPDWRAVARALGPATKPRAILAANGTSADPLKIYLTGVNWVQPPATADVVAEVDVIGATKKLPLIATRRITAQPLSKPERTPLGSPVPRSRPPRGARLIARFRVKNWIVARFALARPLRVTSRRLTVLAPRFFRRTPEALLVFFQR